MVDYKLEYEKWLQVTELEQELRDELLSIEQEDQEIKERFYENIQFGTGGLRGVLGAGISRMNVYTLRKATKGLALNILDNMGSSKEGQTQKPSVVIAYDCRNKSRVFAEEAAKVLAANGILAYVFDELQPTPVLSFAVRELKATAGIVITASHNPPEYNGYKVYWSDGAQVASERANEIMAKIESVDDVFTIPVLAREIAEEKGLLVWLETNGEVLSSYYKNVSKIVLQSQMIVELEQSSQPLNIVFTPLHGAANKPVRQALADAGFQNVTVVKEQEQPDANFPTVAYPNPEEPAAFAMAIEYARELDADIIIGTDPDGDRLGVLAKDEQDKYAVLTGNQTGAILLEYILSKKQALGLLPANGIMIKTIVTSELGRVIASHYGVETEDTLTGFKYIGERIEEYKQTGEKQFQFGYEESYGYLIQDFARDKDGVQAAVMAAEVAAYYKGQGKTLYQAMQEIYQKYGYFMEDLHTISLKGIEGLRQISEMLSKLRQQPMLEVAGLRVTEIADYETSENQKLLTNGTREVETITLPKSNVIRYTLEDNSWFCVRPSGTEPKIKFYFAVQGETSEQAREKLKGLKAGVLNFFN